MSSDVRFDSPRSDLAERSAGAVPERGATWERAGHLAIGAVAILSVFFYLQFATDAILDVDGYYHIRWSRLLWDGILRGAFPHSFPYLPLTTLNPQDYVDHHLLFHILLIPFTWIFADIRFAAKVAAALFGSLAVLSCYWLIVQYNIKYRLVWLVALLACSAPFLYRLSMTRAQSISIVFMVAGIYLLFERRYVWLAPLAFLYVWTYSLFVLLCAAAVIWTLVLFWSERRFDWRPAVWTAAGTLAGFIINPYFPKNVKLFVEHLLIKVRVQDFPVSVGSEWYPYESWYFLGSCVVAFAAMVAGYIAFDWTDRKRAAHPLFFLLFATLLLIINFRSRRFVEYWPPFAVLFAAFALQPIVMRAREWASRMPADILNELQPFLDRHERVETAAEKRSRESLHTAVAAIVIALLCVPLFFNVRETARTIASDESPDAYRGGMEWIRNNVPKGERIFNTDWDDFPKMFFYSTDHVYISGLDPNYLLTQNPELSKLYENVTLGREKDAASIIRNRFGARYVFTDNEPVHDDFYYNAIDSGWFEVVYEDPKDECTVLRIRDERAEPTQTDGGNDDGSNSDDNMDAPDDDAGDQ